MPRYDFFVVAEAFVTFSDLIRFHREFIAPDMERIFARLDQNDRRWDDAAKHFDAIYKRFDRVDSELAALNAGMRRRDIKARRTRGLV